MNELFSIVKQEVDLLRIQFIKGFKTIDEIAGKFFSEKKLCNIEFNIRRVAAMRS